MNERLSIILRASEVVDGAENAEGRTVERCYDLRLLDGSVDLDYVERIVLAAFHGRPGMALLPSAGG